MKYRISVVLTISTAAAVLLATLLHLSKTHTSNGPRIAPSRTTAEGAAQAPENGAQAEDRWLHSNLNGQVVMSSASEFIHGEEVDRIEQSAIFSVRALDADHWALTTKVQTTDYYSPPSGLGISTRLKETQCQIDFRHVNWAMAFVLDNDLQSYTAASDFNPAGRTAILQIFEPGASHCSSRTTLSVAGHDANKVDEVDPDTADLPFDNFEHAEEARLAIIQHADTKLASAIEEQSLWVRDHLPSPVVEFHTEHNNSVSGEYTSDLAESFKLGPTDTNLWRSVRTISDTHTNAEGEKNIVRSTFSCNFDPSIDWSGAKITEYRPWVPSHGAYEGPTRYAMNIENQRINCEEIDYGNNPATHFRSHDLGLIFSKSENAEQFLGEMSAHAPTISGAKAR